MSKQRILLAVPIAVAVAVVALVAVFAAFGPSGEPAQPDDRVGGSIPLPGPDAEQTARWAQAAAAAVDRVRALAPGLPAAQPPESLGPAVIPAANTADVTTLVTRAKADGWVPSAAGCAQTPACPNPARTSVGGPGVHFSAEKAWDDTSETERWQVIAAVAGLPADSHPSAKIHAPDGTDVILVGQPDGWRVVVWAGDTGE